MHVPSPSLHSDPAPLPLVPTRAAFLRSPVGWLRTLDPTQPLWQIVFFRFCSWIVMLLVTFLYRLRFYGLHNLPPSGTGGLLVVANHQSHWDPPVLGIAFRTRNMASIAREGLFKAPGLKQLLLGLGAIPIKESEGDAGAIRTAIAELKKGRLTLIFPEGSRSPDGEIKDFKRGAWVLLSRAKCDVMPAAIEGAFDSWPRRRHFPGLFGHRIGVAFGKPIPYNELKALGADAGLARLQSEVERLRADLAVRLGIER